MRETLLTLVALAGVACALAQPSSVLADPYAEFDDARTLFEDDAFALAAGRYAEVLEAPALPGTASGTDERQRAELRRALAAQRAELPEAAMLLDRFVDRYSPQPIALQAIKQVADGAFAERDYARAAAYYARLPLSGLAPGGRDEVRFRLGYTAFASKDFALASRYLGDLRATPGTYREPAAYYYALTQYYRGDNAAARAAFEQLGRSERYAGVVPGNLAQLYFADGDFERVIAYATPLVDRPETRQRSQIHLLIGRSYFELGRYAEALPYLEYYAERSKKMSAADFYQLGYAQYQAGYVEPAAENLRQLDGEDSALGQAALYYLGNAYLKLDRRGDARAAFQQVTTLDYDARLREEAAWNAAKLNYELGYQQEALTALQAIPASSRYYGEAQALLGRVILNSRDYAKALDVLDGLDAPTPALRETRQRVLVLRGLQQHKARRYDEAQTLLSRSLEDASDAYFKALASYWLGDIAYRRGELSQAAARLNSFITTARGVATALPDDANPATANYLLGYVFLKREDYGVALGHFQEALVGLQQRADRTGATPTLARMRADAGMRAGDAAFKRNDYAQATPFYEQAVEQLSPGYDYALYQLAIIEGLRGDHTEKIIALEAIVDDVEDSAFADDALLELGRTYQGINQLNRAKAALERLVAEHPDSPLRNEALLQLGLVSINQGTTETAINFYKQVFAHQPKANEVRRAQAALQEIYVDDLGRPDDYFAFLATVPGYKLDASLRDSISYAAAESQYQSARYDRAVEQYGRYLQEFPRGAYALEAVWHRADAYLVLERYAEALDDYESIIQRGDNPYYEESLERAARIAYDAEADYAKASRYYARLLESESPRAQSPELKALALRAAYRSGDTRAVEPLAQAVVDDEGVGAEEKAIANFYLGKLAYDRKDYDVALARFNGVIRSSEGEAAAEARYLVARIYYLRREFELAENIALAAQQQSTAYPYWVAKSSLLLADIFLEDDDFLNARAVAQAVTGYYQGDEALEREARAKLAEVERAAAAASRVAPTDSTAIDLEYNEPN